VARRGRAHGTVGGISYGAHSGSGIRFGPTRTVKRRPPPPPLPPAGSYDPALDAARNAASRGLLDTRQDTGLQLGRAGQDYSLGVEGLQRAQTRGTEDIATQRLRGNQDYSQNTALLRRSFNILAGKQQESANAAGLIGGGALLQAAAKRQANQGIQQQALDVGHTRLNEDLTRAGTRLGEDTQTGIGQLGLGYTRQTTDLSTGLQRATRENTQFGLDTAAQRAYQATQSGWDPPRPPKPKPQAHPHPPHPTTLGRYRNRRQGTGRI
jgi:hypothetical protein